MNQSDLLMGDLIFYVSPSLDIVEHTAIYLGEKDGVPYVLHATQDGYNAMMMTHLKNRVDADFKYRVMRPRNEELSVNAIIIFIGWVELQVPYASKEKINQLMSNVERICSLELKESAGKQADFGKKDYRSNYSQYLTMLNALPFVEGNSTCEEGFGCAESIVVAFNLALLKQHAKQESSCDGQDVWSIGNISLDEFIDKLKNPLPFNAQSSLSAGLYEHCANSPDHWIAMGELCPQAAITPDEDAKEVWRGFKEQLKQRSLNLVEKLRSKSESPAMKSFLLLEPSSPRNMIDIIKYASADDELSELTMSGTQSPTGSEPGEGRPRLRTWSTGSPIIGFFSPRAKSTSNVLELKLPSLS